MEKKREEWSNLKEKKLSFFVNQNLIIYQKIKKVLSIYFIKEKN